MRLALKVILILTAQTETQTQAMVVLVQELHRPEVLVGTAALVLLLLPIPTHFLH
jgi:hypothetical protein